MTGYPQDEIEPWDFKPRKRRNVLARTIRKAREAAIKAGINHGAVTIKGVRYEFNNGDLQPDSKSPAVEKHPFD